eukprot:112348_1
MSASFTDSIDIFKQYSSSNNELISKINFAGIIGSTALMTYLYGLSCSKDKLEKTYGEDFAPKFATYFRWGILGAGALTMYHFLLYSKYPIKKMENKLNVSNKFNVSDKTRYIIASCIAIPALIVEILGWMEAKSAPLNPGKTQNIIYKAKLYGGVYNYMRHPIFFCEFTWCYTLSLLLNNPMLLVISGVIMQPACYIMCKFDEKDALNKFGNEYKQYMDRTGFWFPKLW